MSSKHLFLGILLLVSIILSCKTRRQKNNCIDLTSLEYTWRNSYIIEQSYSGNHIMVNPQTIYPVGYFKINPNHTYEVYSDGVPHNGSWSINPKTCRLILDHGSAVSRSFSIDLLTKDSLIISRKDTLYHLIYQQHYSKSN